MARVRVEPIGGNTGRKEYTLESNNGTFRRTDSIESDDEFGSDRSVVHGQAYGLPDVWVLESDDGGLFSSPGLSDVTLRDRGLRVRVDGRPVASSAVGKTVEIRPRQSAGGAGYSFNASGGISASEEPDLEPDDTLMGTRVEGTVWGRPDSYTARGSLWNFAVPDSVDIVVDGEVCNKKLVVVPQNNARKQYTIRTSGEIVGMADTESHDSAIDGVAKGFAYGQADTYRYSGDFIGLQGDLSGMQVFADGERVDSAARRTIKFEPDRNLGGAEYSFSVSGSVVATDDIESDDEIDSGDVTGTVWMRPDTYKFSGELTDLDVPEGLTVVIDGTPYGRLLEISPTERPFVARNYEIELGTDAIPLSSAETHAADSVEDTGDGVRISGRIIGAPDAYLVRGR